MYVISHLSIGTLPWLHFRNPNEVQWIKRLSPDSLLFGHLPGEIQEIQDYLCETEFGILPDYGFIGNSLRKAMEKFDP